jgi:hypothetical protein
MQSRFLACTCMYRRGGGGGCTDSQVAGGSHTNSAVLSRSPCQEEYLSSGEGQSSAGSWSGFVCTLGGGFCCINAQVFPWIASMNCRPAAAAAVAAVAAAVQTRRRLVGRCWRLRTSPPLCLRPSAACATCRCTISSSRSALNAAWTCICALGEFVILSVGGRGVEGGGRGADRRGRGRQGGGRRVRVKVEAGGGGEGKAGGRGGGARQGKGGCHGGGRGGGWWRVWAGGKGKERVGVGLYGGGGRR